MQSQISVIREVGRGAYRFSLNRASTLRLDGFLGTFRSRFLDYVKIVDPFQCFGLKRGARIFQSPKAGILCHFETS